MSEVSDHWRLGVVERAVLEALDALEARPDRPHRKCANVVSRMAGGGVSARYGYEALCTMAKPWLMNIPLVDFHGNCGSLDDPPANPRYTEARLSRAGLLALAAERGDDPRVPVTLINGDLHVDGNAPPFSPRRVIAALRALADYPRLADSEIADIVGSPESPTGCGITCDHRALATGEWTAIVLTANISIEDAERGTQFVLSGLPLGIGPERVLQALAGRAELFAKRRRPGSDTGVFAELGLPLRDLRNESYADVTRIVCEIRPEADPHEVERQIASTWGVTTRLQVQLPAPLVTLVRELVDENSDAQLHTLSQLEAAFDS